MNKTEARETGQPQAVALTVPQVAAALQVAPASIYRLVDRGLLHPSRALRTMRFSRPEIDRFLSETI